VKNVLRGEACRHEDEQKSGVVQSEEAMGEGKDQRRLSTGAKKRARETTADRNLVLGGETRGAASSANVISRNVNFLTERILTQYVAPCDINNVASVNRLFAGVVREKILGLRDLPFMDFVHARRAGVPSWHSAPKLLQCAGGIPNMGIHCLAITSPEDERSMFAIIFHFLETEGANGSRNFHYRVPGGFRSRKEVRDEMFFPADKNPICGVVHGNLLPRRVQQKADSTNKCKGKGPATAASLQEDLCDETMSPLQWRGKSGFDRVMRLLGRRQKPAGLTQLDADGFRLDADTDQLDADGALIDGDLLSDPLAQRLAKEGELIYSGRHPLLRAPKAAQAAGEEKKEESEDHRTSC
jgi:hypothetical protein